jgi:transcriptional regulator with XRE-family HTH domain
MNQGGYASTAVRIIHPLQEPRRGQNALQVLDAPPRSRLYGLLPRERGTIWHESLTSYLNRLGWRHGVSPRRLFALEIAPHLRSDYPRRQIGTFSSVGAMSLNGNGNLALECVRILERLTTRTDLHQLTLHGWVGDLQTRSHLRERPAWCPACYADWQERGLPLYEPLLWMLQVVTICPRHHTRLEQQCPSCQKRPSFLNATTMPGVCPHCNAWLGTPSNGGGAAEVDEETPEWQKWVVRSLDELRGVCVAAAPPPWEQFFSQLATCCEAKGDQSRLAELTGLARGQFARWLHSSYTPTLESILEFCYACDVTPLQVIKGNVGAIKHVIQTGRPYRLPRSRRSLPPVDRQRCLAALQAVLAGSDEALGYAEIARRLGCSTGILRYHFPDECALITTRVRAHRKQRVAQRLERVRSEVRQAVMAVHAQGFYPSQNKVADLLSDPNLMRMPEAKAAWLDARRELESGL